MTNYYEILGVSSDASSDEIKTAFRQLAMKHHPDKNPGNTEAETKFKEINEAYQTLSDDAKRSEYDHIRKYGGNSGPFQHRGGFNHSTHDFNFTGNPGNVDEMIRQFFEQTGFSGNPFGSRHVRRNRDLNVAIEITLEDVLSGKDVPLSFEHNGTKVNITARIPCGVEHGTRMRFQGHGDNSVQGIPPGDLYLTINIARHSIYRRDQQHLHAELKVDAIDAILGYNVNFNCIDGTKVNIKVPAGTQHGNVLKISGKGLPTYQNSNNKGDMLLIVSITIPKDLTLSQRKNLEKVSKSLRNRTI